MEKTKADITTLTDRKLVGDWLNAAGLTGEGVEVGVQAGENAERILERWKGTLHLVDSWAKWPDAVYQDRTNEIDFEKAMQETIARVARFQPRAPIHKMSSAAAARMFIGQEKKFDFVYLDANHSFEFIYKDLKQWWRLLRNGGLMGGHDYLTRYNDAWICEVEHAVTDFFKFHANYARRGPYTVHVTQEEGGHPSWWVVK